MPEPQFKVGDRVCIGGVQGEGDRRIRSFTATAAEVVTISGDHNYVVEFDDRSRGFYPEKRLDKLDIDPGI